MTAHGASPWVGLRPFRMDDEPRFFGRSIETREVADLWQRNRVTLLIGDSGVGKTSLLHAGLVPFLANDGARVVPIGELSYRKTLPAPLLTARGRTLFALLSSWQPTLDPARSVGLTVAEFFRRQTAAAPPGASTLVAIDGAESALRRSGASKPEHRRFREELGVALQAFPGVQLLLSIRPDCVDDARAFAGVLGETPAQYVLRPLDRQSAIDALSRPLLGSHQQFDLGVPARLVDKLAVEHGTSGAAHVEPVLLQVLCTELWEGLRDGKTLSATVEKALDDVDAMLAEFCTRTLFTMTSDHGLPNCEIGGWMRRTFTTSPDEGSTYEARPAPRHDRPKEITDSVVRAVEDRHLLKYCRLSDEDGFQLQHPRMASALQRLGEAPAARPDPTPGDLLREAEKAMSADNLRIAERYARAVLAMTEGVHSEIHVSAYVILGDIAYLRSEHDVALQNYDNALAMAAMADARSPAVAYLFAAIARVHLMRGDTDNALGSARAGRLVPAGETTTTLELAQALWRANRHQAAVKELNFVLDRDPAHCEALRIRGEIYADWGKSRQALNDLRSVATAAPPSARAAYILAVHLDVPVSRGAIDELRDEGRSHGMVLLYLARSLYRRGDRYLAMDLADEALQATNPRLSRHHRAQAEKIARR
ncbi:tetratricopeptide repeat protein [Nonomuraea sp. NPDC050547]|uniref:nSTAND1 domain-containing NTPase n=1 Tax=Nonomuraea sp. NPDC050547 TaxID=3364368 RepID=UPI00378A7812